MSDDFKNQMFTLEKKLTEAYAKFKKVYAENFNNKQLTNKEISKHIMDENNTYNTQLKQIKLQALSIMQQICEEHDQAAYNEILTKLHQAK